MYIVVVCELCEFMVKQGDLDLCFILVLSVFEGMVGYVVVVVWCDEFGYQSELILVGEYCGWFWVCGWVDGYDVDCCCVEEVKIYKGWLECQFDMQCELYWVQVCIYGWLLCEQEGFFEIEVVFVYYNIGSQQEMVFIEWCSVVELCEYFEQYCECFFVWVELQFMYCVV